MIWDGWGGGNQTTWQVPDWLDPYYNPGGQQITTPVQNPGFGGFGMPTSYTHTQGPTYLGMQLPQQDVAGYLQQLLMARMNQDLGQDQLAFQQSKWSDEYRLLRDRFAWDKDVWGKEFDWGKERFGKELGQRKVESLRNFGTALMSPLLSWEMGKMNMPTAGQMLRAKGWLV